ncbi:MAG TPA: ATP-grasp domain-containing protein [bacterium]|nr:ATP-grasp domain-containing protein [bacterium]
MKKKVLEGKTLLVVHTATLKKKFALQTLKKMGLTLVMLNKEKNWAQPYVDHWILADLTNYNDCIQSTKRWMNRHPEIKIDGVLTFWEESVILVSKLVDTFNLIGIPFHIARRARNKFLFRKFCHENGILAPKYFLAKSKDEIKKNINALTFPVVIKPIYGSSSAFVIKANTLDELLRTYDFSKNNVSTHADAAEWDELEFLVEEYIDGDEVDIDMLIQNGKLKYWSMSDNDKTNEPYFVEVGQNIPSNLPQQDQEELVEMAEDVLEKLGIQNAVIHFEAKSTSKGPVPIECNLRMGGDEVHSFNKGVWGIDLVEYAAFIALGVHFPKIHKSEEPKTYLVGKYFLPQESGIIANLDIGKKLDTDTHVYDFHFFKEVGDPVLAPPQGYEYLGWLTASGENIIDAEDNLRDFMEEVKFDIVKYDDASSLGKTQRRSRFDSAILQKNRILGAAKIEKIRRINPSKKKELHIGIAGNLYSGSSTALDQYSAEQSQQLQEVLTKQGYSVSFFDFNNLPKVLSDLKRTNIDLMFNACDRINGTTLLEAHSGALLDLLQIPYTGSNVFTIGLCNDKIRFKKLLEYHDIPMAAWDYAYSMDDHVRDDLEYPLIVKPANTDGAIGLTNQSVVSNAIELHDQMERIIIGLGRPVLIEEFIAGDEFDVCILGNTSDDQRVLPLTRYQFKSLPKDVWPIFTYSAKWENDEQYSSVIAERPAKKINKKLLTLITEIALDAYNILDCHDYGRAEFRVDANGNPYLIEINANPLLHQHGCFVQTAQLLDMNQGDLIEEIINMAITRYKTNPPYTHLQMNDM